MLSKLKYGFQILAEIQVQTEFEILSTVGI